ncbi:MAG: dethiobiotin synthase [Gammaproteobacteria bacterium]|jgi:dethiobiotin synthetase
MSGLFVTGTDTGVGKTVVSLALMRALQSGGQSVVGMKPVASGCQAAEAGLVNADALQLQAQGSVPLSYDRVNPYAFEPPVAPHLAAATLGAQVEIPVIQAAYRALANAADRVIVEGVGGWLVPIGPRHTMADVARALGLPVVVVVAIRLGCLSHALLTAAAVARSGLGLAGWVANRIDPACLNPDEIVDALRVRLEAPLLADLPYEVDGTVPKMQAHRIDSTMRPG